MDFHPRIDVFQLHHGMRLDQDPAYCCPGDTLVFQEKGLIYVLLEELMRDKTHVTWNAVIVAHFDPTKLGTETMVGFGTTRPLPDGGIIMSDRP